jgi:hypothetical protein
MDGEIMNPQALAYLTIAEMQDIGLAKGHQLEAWKTEPLNNHLDKACRHILTYKLIKEGNSPDDGEMHLKNAITRLAFALYQELGYGAAE